ncbi:MAG: hypothetical protein D8M53_05720 [Armatimonadetes bacterium]|nr:hypothetical protein [Armatimonadota bacterium]
MSMHILFALSMNGIFAFLMALKVTKRLWAASTERSVAMVIAVWMVLGLYLLMTASAVMHSWPPVFGTTDGSFLSLALVVFGGFAYLVSRALSEE